MVLISWSFSYSENWDAEFKVKLQAMFSAAFRMLWLRSYFSQSGFSIPKNHTPVLSMGLCVNPSVVEYCWWEEMLSWC